ncbi:tRNA glutamyl-Q(34) synthetase GluQRS [Rhodanobacter denitrificans]|uniref:Glutamyl-Q tRNA(Asp) synthetase n=1 Tax=Rhodanobacter denitrificans TaxID=666685 RepID=M4NI06_9GAMM|nr:tRNA glutamyl-Q(34) synthetase GluQRS [Rhodanobacter denitrificans]AGG89737.1 glutamyl-queuosine tRNA(Asp) synthetase [Rhodanobacter denitrificans]UJM85137.1 tRNA glutamyl-Q(34) synthetase GluQRS [Rhodanobacter denitrificans]
MSYRGRFAPSPTGHLHFGSLVAAVGSWLCARHAGGEWLLRIEDIDPPREVPGSAASILAALPAFGLVADPPALFQSQRIAAYDAAFERLRAAGQVFPCWCSRSDLADAGGIHRDGRCVASPQAAQAPAWRLRVPDIAIAFDDALQGPQRQNLRDEVGDFVIRRVEGLYSYQLACVVDDAYQRITEVVRGLDLLDSTARQIWLQRCLGLPTPAYRHLPLVLDGEGRKLSKSGQAFPIDPAAPLPALRQALAFLRVPALPAAADAHQLLVQALANFDPADLPHCSGHSVA